MNRCQNFMLKNTSTFVAYNAIKYFYAVIVAKWNNQNGFSKN